MANTVIQLKHSTLTGNVPSSLANGEISINNRDGKFFYSTPAGVVVTHYPYPGPAGLNGEIQFNDSGVLGTNSGLTFSKTTGYFTAPIVASSNNGNGTNFKVGDDAWIGDINLADTISIKGQQNSANAYIGFGNNDGVRLGRAGSGPLAYGGAFTANGEISSLQSSGDEGGQFNLALAATNQSLSGSVAIDIYQNKFRIYETGGTNRGVFIDMANSAATSVGTDLLSSSSSTDNWARGQANAAFIQANTPSHVANSAASYANSAFLTANNSAGVNLTQNSNITSASSYANSAFLTANTPSHVANSAALYANSAFLTANTPSHVANSAALYANSAFIKANDSIKLSGSSTIGTVQLNSNTGEFSIFQTVSSWPNSTSHPIFKWSYNTPYDDNLYFASGGNAAPNTQTALILSENQGVLFGRGATNPSSNTNPLTNEWMRITNNVLTVNGTANIQSTTDSTSTVTGALRVAGGVGVAGNVYANAVYDGGVEVIVFANNAYNQANTANTRAFNSVLKAGDTMTGALNISNSTASTNTTTGALIVLGGVGISGALNATTKSFNIKHPTKKGKNLTYGSLEGPEFGVYVRGRTKENVIELPDYWVKLIDANTITVQLTPIGNYQTLFVEKIENNKVYIKNSNLVNRSIDCFYIIFAERADVDKLKVEN